MEVSKNQIDNCNATLTVKIKKEDINEEVNKRLSEYRKSAKVPGFRPGKVPMGMIKKMFENSVIAEELNKAVSNALYEFISKEKLNVLGDPLPNENQEQIDFTKTEDFNFIFDIALMPEFEMNLTKKDKVTEFVIKVDENLKKAHIENYQSKFGKFEQKDKSNEKSVVKGVISQTDKDGNVIEEGIIAEDASLLIEMIKDKNIQKQFMNVEKDAEIDFDIFKAFDGNMTEISSLLKIKKEEIENLDPNFKFKVNEIKDFVMAEINQDLFDMAFPQDKLKTKKEFEAKVVENIEKVMADETGYLLSFYIKEKLIEKLTVDLPEEFLKRWLKTTNKEVTDEQVETEFPMFIENLKWTMIKNKLAKENKIEVSEEEMMDAAKQRVTAQLRQYGVDNIPQEHLDNFAKEMMQKDDEKEKSFQQKLEEKIIEIAKEQIKIEQKKVTVDELNEITAKKFNKK